MASWTPIRMGSSLTSTRAIPGSTSHIPQYKIKSFKNYSYSSK